MPVYACLAWQKGLVRAWLVSAGRPATCRARRSPALFLALGAVGLPGPARAVVVSPGVRSRRPRIRAAGAALVAKLAAVPGPVLVPDHPHLARLAGKATHAHEMALADVMRGGDRRAIDALAADVRRRLAAREFAAVVVDQDWWRADLGASYVHSQTLWAAEPAVFWPRTGWLVPPARHLRAAGDRALMATPGSHSHGDTPWRADCAFLLVAIAGLLIARIPVMGVRFFDPDELEHAHAAWSVFRGLLPYRDFFEHHTPWYYLGLSPFFRWFAVDQSFESAMRFLSFARGLSLVLTALSVGLLFLRRAPRGES